MARRKKSSKPSARVGHRGKGKWPYTSFVAFYMLISSKQLLEIWRKAKVKERDALLWGDEVWFLPAECPSGLLSLC